jgi:hypothetical protein
LPGLQALSLFGRELDGDLNPAEIQECEKIGRFLCD